MTRVLPSLNPMTKCGYEHTPIRRGLIGVRHLSECAVEWCEIPAAGCRSVGTDGRQEGDLVAGTAGVTMAPLSTTP
jgi:hypothetical protein